jgi:2'-5' RNA ligase
MQESTYAVVSYLSGPVADLINSLRRSLNPMFADWLAHVSVLPPRRLPTGLADQEDRLERLRKICHQASPFDLELQDVSTFWPVNGVVYLSVSTGYAELVSLHQLLSECGMQSVEAYGYVPHVTIAQSLDEADTHKAMAQVAEAWSALAKPVRLHVDSLVLVEQPAGEVKWANIESIKLGSFALTAE